MQTLCFTGHRKINGFYHGPLWDTLSVKLADVIQRAITRHNITNFISGGAIGVDTIGAEAVIAARANNNNLNLIIARPFSSQDSKWGVKTRARYARILAAADQVHDCFQDINRNKSEEAQRKEVAWKMQGRNIWMVDQANLVIGIWDGVKAGGTYNCLKYAWEVRNKRPLKMLVIHPTLLTEQYYKAKLNRRTA